MACVISKRAFVVFAAPKPFFYLTVSFIITDSIGLDVIITPTTDWATSGGSGSRSRSDAKWGNRQTKNRVINGSELKQEMLPSSCHHDGSVNLHTIYAATFMLAIAGPHRALSD